MSEQKQASFAPLWIFLGVAVAILVLAAGFVYLTTPRYVPEYPTVTRVCEGGDDFDPVPIVIDGEPEILPCNDPVTIYPKADQ